jgi:hypothetical protein
MEEVNLMAETKSGAMLDWMTEEDYWRKNYSSRPYTGQNSDFEYWKPAYRYGYDSAGRHQGRKWDEVENDLRSGWSSYEHRGTSTWEQIKDAVKDGWDRLVGNRPH